MTLERISTFAFRMSDGVISGIMNETNGLDHIGNYFQPFEEHYRITASVAYAIIFLLGFTGNSLLIFTIYISRSLHTSAYAYLASLACADLLVICSAVPEGIVYTLSSGLWFSGSVTCSVFIFTTFFSMSVGTLSMTAYTIERYIAVCRPLLAKKISTRGRTRRIILASWLTAALYCSPWFVMAQMHTDELYPQLKHCEIAVPPSVYSIVFGTDLILFYIIPLLIAVFSYWNIGRVMKHLPDAAGADCNQQLSGLGRRSTQTHRDSLKSLACPNQSSGQSRASFRPRSITIISRGSIQSSNSVHSTSRRSVSQSLHILVATVLLFGVCWLPFRGLLVYNSFVKEPWLDLWYVLFAKCMIFLNCCVNPFLYTLLSKRFRLYFKTAVTCASRSN